MRSVICFYPGFYSGFEVILSGRDGAGVAAVVSAVGVVGFVKINNHRISFRDLKVNEAAASVGTITVGEVRKGQKKMILELFQSPEPVALVDMQDVRLSI